MWFTYFDITGVLIGWNDGFKYRIQTTQTSMKSDTMSFKPFEKENPKTHH